MDRRRAAVHPCSPAAAHQGVRAVVDDTNNRNKPITHQRDLAKLPRALCVVDRAAAVGNLAMDAEAERQLAEAAISSVAARCLRQH